MITVNIAILIFIISTLCLIFFIYHKIRRIHLMQYDLIRLIEQEIPSRLQNTYQQIQAFIDLNRLLQLPKPLPTLRGWAASPDFLLLLAEHVLQKKPKNIVECSSGASTLVLAQCAKINGQGHVWSMEHDASFAEKTRQLLKLQNLENWATVIDAPLKDYSFNDQIFRWYSLNEKIENTRIDMLIIDGPPANLNHCARYPAGPLLLPLININGVVFLDDTNRSDEKEIIQKWISKFSNFDLYQHYCEKGAVSLNYKDES